MLTQNDLVAELSDNTERFNKDLIKYRRSEPVLNHILDICRALEVIEHITFMGVEVQEDESEIEPEHKQIDIESSRVMLVKLRFKCEYGGETAIVERELLVPKLVDDHFFILNGVRYYPIYQLVDKGVFVTSKMYSLKTLLMPIRFKYKRIQLKDHNKSKISATEFKLSLFKNSINPLYYYLAKMGFEKTIEYFGHSCAPGGDITILECTDEEVAEMANDYTVFNISGNTWLVAEDSAFQNQHDINFLVMLKQVLIEHPKLDNMDDINHWCTILGLMFTKSANAVADKTSKVLFSLERILDEQTKRNMSEVPDEDKTDTYAILRWMIRTFDEHKWMDNMDLSNKRIQVWQFSQPLLRQFSASTYRIVNTRNLSLKSLTSIFNIKRRTIIKRMLSSEQVRYSGHVNTMDLFGVALKATCRAGGGDADISDRFRGIHPSYIGNLSLIASSQSDPGLTTTICPFAKLENGRFV